MSKSPCIDRWSAYREQRALEERDEELDALCEKWAAWCREHHFEQSATAQSAEVVRRGGGTRAPRAVSAQFHFAPSMAAMRIAYACQPNDLDKQVFDLYYVARVKPVKTAAATLGIGRRHFYRVLRVFRQRLFLAAQSFAEGGPQVEKIIGVNDQSVT